VKIEPDFETESQHIWLAGARKKRGRKEKGIIGPKGAPIIKGGSAAREGGVRKVERLSARLAFAWGLRLPGRELSG